MDGVYAEVLMNNQLELQPLADVRVLDLTHGIAGPYCTKLLADFGADVIKIERPSGDYARTLGPFPGDIPHPEKSGLFLFLNTNKRGIVLDLKTPEGVETVKKLVRDTDILVENFRPGVMSALGLDYETLSAINPNLVMTSISNFGQTGPYRDFLASELTLFAMGGAMNRTGLPERYPLKLGGNHVQYQAGNVAAMASLFAWYGRMYQGMGGQEIDISIFETQMGSINLRLLALLQYQYTGDRGVRSGGAAGGGYPVGYYPTQDGYINIVGGGAFWPRTVSLLGMPELLNDPRFAPPMGQLSPEGKEEFENTIWLPWLMERTKEEALSEIQDNEILSGAINNIGEVVDRNPQLDHRKFFVEIDHPVAGKIRYPGAHFVNEAQWWRVRRPAPLLGQHTEEIEKELNSNQGRGIPVANSNSPSSTGRQDNIRTKLPLEGVRVLDITVAWAGPYSTMFLGDMGAEVIRVESLNVFPTYTRGFYARPNPEAEARAPMSFYPGRDPGERPWNRMAIFNMHARNKHSITIDLTTDEGKDIFRRLVELSDVFIENNVAGSMKRLGLTYDTLAQWNSRLIMISAAGVGQTGPWSSYRGFGIAFEALYGHASVIGYPDMDPEGIPASVASDASTGVTIASTTVMALHQREKTGKGAFIDTAVGETLLLQLGELFMDYTINGRIADSPGNRDWWHVQGAYPCAGEDEWIAISIGQIEQWQRFCQLMGQVELLADERFSSMEHLRKNHDQVDEIIREWTSGQSNVGVFHVLQRHQVPAGLVMHEPLAYADPHLKHRKFFMEITVPEVGTHFYPTSPLKMSKIPFEVRKPPVRLGEDNDYVYRKVLALSEEEYDRLKSLNHIGMDYAPHIR
jgi:crotonobetainyl-CoA:carnitine CoA-transferase CaiB-like acyl-CoA transferase